MPEPLLVDDFDHGDVSGTFLQRSNALGSYQGTWAKRPSYTVLSKSATVRRGDRGRSLVIEYKKEGGWCGWYTLLNGVDVTPYNALTFWVKGEKGGEKFDIGLADARMQELEIDAVYAGASTDFLPGGVTTQWRQMKVPLWRVSSEIHLASMGSLVLSFRYGGEGKVYLEDVYFTYDPEIARLEGENAPRAERDSQHPRGLWVWKLDPINDLKQRKQLLEFCGRVAAERIYLYLGELNEADDPAYAKQAGEFLAEASARGVQVEALTGDPTWSFAVNHHEVLAWLDGILAFNAKRPAMQRFAGIQLDVEPYLTSEWNRDKARIADEYVALLRACRERIQASGQAFRFGVAIPVFYSEEPVAFRRGILDAVDYVALMNYFDTHRRLKEGVGKHLPLVRETGKRLVVGIETQDLVRMRQGKPENTFFDEGWRRMEQVLARLAEDLRGEPAFLGLAIHHEGSYRYMTPERNVPLKADRPPVAQLYRLFADGGPAQRRIAVDGDDADWQGCAPTCQLNSRPQAVFGREQWGGPSDTSMEMFAAWDNSALYFLFRVTDDTIWQERQRDDLWAGDHIELWLDVDLEGDYTEAVNSQDDIQFGLSPGNFGPLPPEVYVWTPTIETAELAVIEVAARRTSAGYTLEAAIPWEDLLRWGTRPEWTGQATGWGPHLLAPVRPPLTPRPGFAMGVSVELSDTDDPSAPQKCMLSSSLDRAWGDPTTFGVLELR